MRFLSINTTASRGPSAVTPRHATSRSPSPVSAARCAGPSATADTSSRSIYSTKKLRKTIYCSFWSSSIVLYLSIISLCIAVAVTLLCVTFLLSFVSLFIFVYQDGQQDGRIPHLDLMTYGHGDDDIVLALRQPKLRTVFLHVVRSQVR